MTITDAICESIETIIDEAVCLYGEDEMMQIAEDEDVVEIVALSLKIIYKRGFLKRDQAKKNIDTIDWIARAKEKIIEYIEEHYKE